MENTSTNNIAEMTDEEILRQQLELLAEHSKECDVERLVLITAAMVEIYKLRYLP